MTSCSNSGSSPRNAKRPLATGTLSPDGKRQR